MKCSSCGAELAAGVAPCPSCGAPRGLRGEPAASSRSEVPTETISSPAAAMAGRETAQGAAATASIHPGTILAGRYRIVALAGRGGMGEVWRAEDLELDQTVALKLLPESLARDEVRVSRLLGEVRVARQVSHPNACRVFDVGEADGVRFLSMEFVEGEDLASLLARRGRLPADEARAIGRQVALGLSAAHEQRVLHRDLKPTNVLVDHRGGARIADFGLAEAGDAVRDERAREGTLLYMAPEQLAGREATVASDIFALGLVLHELFTGESVFRAGDGVEARRSAPRLSPRLDELERPVARIVRRCLEEDPSRRPGSARAVAAALSGGGAIPRAVEEAQQRADRVSAFRAELADLRREGVVRLGDAELAGIERHHSKLLRDLAEVFDVDVDERGRRLSLGMRVVSLLGALALGASVFWFFYRIWGALGAATQVTVLVGAPALALLATSAVAARERGRDITLMVAFFAFVAFVTDVSVLSSVFNVRPGPAGYLAFGLFALVLAFGFRLRLLFLSGLTCLAIFLASWLVTLDGTAWLDCLSRPESWFPAGLLFLAAPALVGMRRFPGFAPLARGSGLVLLIFPATILAAEGQMSYLPFDHRGVEVLYQVLGLAGAVAAIWYGVARRRREMVWVASALFVVLLFVEFAKWWWAWMPRWLFFLVIALAAAAIVRTLQKLRAAVDAMPEGDES